MFFGFVGFPARLPGFEFTTEDGFMFLQEVRAAKRPACPLVMPYLISEFFDVKVVDVTQIFGYGNRKSFLVT